MMSQYIREISQKPRMGRKDEVRLSKRLEFFRKRLIQSVYGSSLPKKIRDQMIRTRDCPGVQHPEEDQLLPLCDTLGDCPEGKTGFIKACCSQYNLLRADYVERNLHIVVSLARMYRTYGLPLMDLIQEGNSALIRAVEKYDWRKQVRFQTYAMFWVKQAVERYITANRGIVRVPNYLQQKMRQYKRKGLIQGNAADLSVDEVSKAFDLSSEVAGRLIEVGRGHVSLDAPAPGEDGGSITDLLFVQEEEERLPEGEHDKLRDRLQEALSDLSDQEQLILNHRFGLHGKEIKTLEEIGKLLKVSRERIRQLQIRAIQKLKRPALMERLVPFLP